MLDRLRRSGTEAVLRTLTPTRRVDLVIPSPLGHMLPGRLHLPDGPGPFPGVWLVPGALDGMRAVEGRSCVLTAPALARAGFACLVYTPSGREGTPGPEDHGGPTHREEGAAALSILLDRPEVDPRRVAVLSISFGLTIATNTLATHPELAAQVRVFIDWEGPGHRDWYVPRGSWVDAPDYWDDREAVRRIGLVRCPYRRLQSDMDHVHGPRPEIGLQMARAAADAGLDVRLNESRPPFTDVTWASHRKSLQGRQMLRWLREAT